MGRLREEVSPGGNGLSDLSQSLAEQGNDQLAIEPSSATLVVALGNMPDLCDRLEALEGQLYLPAQPVHFEDLFNARVGVGQCGEDEHLLGILAGNGTNGLTCLLFEREPALGAINRILTLADRADAASDPSLARLDPYRPSCEIPRLAQPGKPLQQRKRLAPLPVLVVGNGPPCCESRNVEAVLDVVVPKDQTIFHGDSPKPTSLITVRRLTPLFRLDGHAREEGTLFIGARGEVALNDLLKVAEIL